MTEWTREELGLKSRWRRPGLRGLIERYWYNWALHHRVVARRRQKVYAKDRAGGSNRPVATLHSYFESRMIDWPRPHWTRRP